MTIEVHDLTKVYGRTLAVDHLTFTVKPGIVTGFLGPNGAGKSTTMRMVLGLDRPTEGTATIDGRPYRDLRNPLTRVGSLLDANWVHSNRSARAHLRWMARANGLSVARVGEVLDLVGLGEVAGKRAGQFSLGMKQRLGLAGALLGDPGVLLFDEPVNGLDPEGIVWIRTLMRSLAAQGRTVLVSSHLLSEMALTADHLVVIGRGRLIADAPTADFIAAATRSAVRIRSPRLGELMTMLVTHLGAEVRPDPARQLAGAQVADTHPGAHPSDVQPGGTQPGGTQPGGAASDAAIVSGVTIEQIGDAAAAAGIALHELSPQAGSLEQAFMELTAQATEFTAHSGTPAVADLAAIAAGGTGGVGTFDGAGAATASGGNGAVARGAPPQGFATRDAASGQGAPTGYDARTGHGAPTGHAPATRDGNLPIAAPPPADRGATVPSGSARPPDPPATTGPQTPPASRHSAPEGK